MQENYLGEGWGDSMCLLQGVQLICPDKNILWILFYFMCIHLHDNWGRVERMMFSQFSLSNSIQRLIGLKNFFVEVFVGAIFYQNSVMGLCQTMICFECIIGVL